MDLRRTGLYWPDIGCWEHAHPCRAAGPAQPQRPLLRVSHRDHAGEPHFRKAPRPQELRSGDGGAAGLEAEQRRQPELARVETVEAPQQSVNEFEMDLTDEAEEDVARTSRMTRVVQGVARQVALDPNDGMEL